MPVNGLKSSKTMIFYFVTYVFLFHYCIYKGNKMLINGLKSNKNQEFLFRYFLSPYYTD